MRNINKNRLLSSNLLKNKIGALNTRCYFYNSNKEEIALDDVSGINNNCKIIRNITDTGYYYLRIHSLSDIGNYYLKLNF